MCIDSDPFQTSWICGGVLYATERPCCLDLLRFSPIHWIIQTNLLLCCSRVKLLLVVFVESFSPQNTWGSRTQTIAKNTQGKQFITPNLQLDHLDSSSSNEKRPAWWFFCGKRTQATPCGPFFFWLSPRRIREGYEIQTIPIPSDSLFLVIPIPSDSLFIVIPSS